MLEDLMLPWTTLLDSWRCARPLPAPTAILSLLSQSSGVRPELLLPGSTETDPNHMQQVVEKGLNREKKLLQLASGDFLEITLDVATSLRTK